MNDKFRIVEMIDMDFPESDARLVKVSKSRPLASTIILSVVKLVS